MKFSETPGVLLGICAWFAVCACAVMRCVGAEVPWLLFVAGGVTLAALGLLAAAWTMQPAPAGVWCRRAVALAVTVASAFGVWAYLAPARFDAWGEAAWQERQREQAAAADAMLRAEQAAAANEQRLTERREARHTFTPGMIVEAERRVAVFTLPADAGRWGELCAEGKDQTAREFLIDRLSAGAAWVGIPRGRVTNMVGEVVEIEGRGWVWRWVLHRSD